nr:light-inducible protein CPRF2 [Ipomoea batatas]
MEASVFSPKPVVPLEGKAERTNQMDAKREKRLLANKEAAKRSRRKKEHLKEFETQVSEMKAENSYLWEHVTEISLKLSIALADKKILEADNETLRAKVAMAEETFKGVIGMHLTLPPEISTMSIPSFPDNHLDQSLCYNSEIQNDLLDISLLNNAWQDYPTTTTGMNNMEVMMAEETVKRIQGEGSLENLPNCTNGFNSNSLDDEKQ